MILCPLANKGSLIGSVWVQRRPYITQEFGKRPEVYKLFGMAGHNGLDFRAATGTSIFSPIEGKVKVINQGDKGYGLHVQIEKGNLRVILAHLSKVLIEDGQLVYFGQKIALSGNTGFSSAPHLHVTVKRLADGGVLKSDNGYGGAFDFSALMLTWKGNLIDPEYGIS